MYGDTMGDIGVVCIRFGKCMGVIGGHLYEVWEVYRDPERCGRLHLKINCSGNKLICQGKLLLVCLHFDWLMICIVKWL